MKRVTKSFRLDPELIQRIQEEADRKNRSFNNLVETTLKDVFTDGEKYREFPYFFDIPPYPTQQAPPKAPNIEY